MQTRWWSLVAFTMLTMGGLAKAQTPEVQREVTINLALLRLEKGVEIARSVSTLAVTVLEQPVRQGEKAGAFVRQYLRRKDK